MGPLNKLRIAIAISALALAHSASAQGLYARADFGFLWAQETDIEDKNCNSANALLGCGNSISGDYNSPGAGLGLGFMPLRWLRSDVTGFYAWSGDFSGKDKLTPQTTTTAEVTSLTGLVNAYIEIAGLTPGGLGAFKPYVGAGIGASRNRVKDVRSTVAGVNFTTPGGSNTDLAWSIAAGTGIQLTNSLALDLGYRFMDIGRVETDAGNATVLGVTVPVDGTESDRIKVHLVTVGLRYSF